MIDPIIVDDLIPTRYQEDLVERLMYNTPYQFQPGTALSQGKDYNVCIDQNTVDSPQFVHYALESGISSDTANIIRPMFYFLEDRLNRKLVDVGRVKINCLLRNGDRFTKNNYNIPHTDDSDPSTLSMIYYVNDSDGDTFFFNESWGQTQNGMSLYARSSPKKGRAVIFNSQRFHAGSNPIDSQHRFVINVTFKLDREWDTGLDK